MKVACKLYFLKIRVHYYINICIELRQNGPCSRDLCKKTRDKSEITTKHL
eukprot:COSAG02_NODE_23481_length_717_cov_1.550162_1_plen_49_part_10